LVLALGAVWLGTNEAGPAKLLAVAAVLALFAAPLIAPRRHRHIRKPKKQLDVLNGDLGRNGGKSEMSKPVDSRGAQRGAGHYSSPRFTEFGPMSGASSKLDWEPSDDESFQGLRPFYLVHSKRDCAVLAVRLKFSGERTFQGWQPVATVPRQDADAGHSDEAYELMVIGYVPPGVHFDAKVRLRDSESRTRVAVMRDLVVSDAPSFQAVHLKISEDKHFEATA
jgi:hypothetical protein